MGLFKRLSESVEKSAQIEEKAKEILVTTTDDIPGRKYEVLGLVTADVGRPANRNFQVVAQELQKEAAKLGADAIIGFRAAVYVNQVNWTAQTAYGTAIRFVDE